MEKFQNTKIKQKFVVHTNISIVNSNDRKMYEKYCIFYSIFNLRVK